MVRWVETDLKNIGKKALSLNYSHMLFFSYFFSNFLFIIIELFQYVGEVLTYVTFPGIKFLPCRRWSMKVATQTLRQTWNDKFYESCNPDLTTNLERQVSWGLYKNLIFLTTPSEILVRWVDTDLKNIGKKIPFIKLWPYVFFLQYFYSHGLRNNVPLINGKTIWPPLIFFNAGRLKSTLLCVPSCANKTGCLMFQEREQQPLKGHT